MLKKIVIRLVSALPIFVCIGVGFKAGLSGVFAGYGLIAPKVALAIRETPTLFVVAYAVLVPLLVSLGGFSIYKVGRLNVEPVSGKQIIKMSFLSIVFGFTMSLTYWSVLQILLILLQMLR